MTHSAENDALVMRLATTYYTPLGWALDDGEDVDPDDLAECLRAMSPVASVVRDLLAKAWDEGATCVSRGRPGERWHDNPYRVIPPGVGDAS